MSRWHCWYSGSPARITVTTLCRVLPELAILQRIPFLRKNSIPGQGCLRLVMGLGTSAVDRTEGLHPRLASLDKPSALAYKDSSNIQPFTRSVEVSPTKVRKALRESDSCRTRSREVLPEIYETDLPEHDTDAERMMRERGINRTYYIYFLQRVVQNAGLMKDMKDLLEVLAAGVRSGGRY